MPLDSHTERSSSRDRQWAYKEEKKKKKKKGRKIECIAGGRGLVIWQVGRVLATLTSTSDLGGLMPLDSHTERSRCK
jgi:hypothetical protein